MFLQARRDAAVQLDHIINVVLLAQQALSLLQTEANRIGWRDV